MRNLTTTLCLTLAVLLGSVGVCFALTPCPENYPSSTWTNCFGTLTDASGSKYMGEFKNGGENGNGTYTYSDGGKYIGDFKNGKFHGWGTHFYADGAIYMGEWKNGSEHGKGIETFPNGDKYVGDFQNDEYHGSGTFTFADGRAKQTGYWEAGEFRAKGWDWSYGVGVCANAPRNSQWGNLVKPYVIDRTGTRDIAVNLHKLSAIYKTLQNRSYNDPKFSDFYRIEYLNEKIDICFRYLTYPDAVVIDNRPFFEMTSEKEINQNQIFITILSNVNCGAPCAFGIAQTFSFSANSLSDRDFYKTKSFVDENYTKEGVAVFPPPKFLSRLSVKETQEYELFRKMRKIE